MTKRSVLFLALILFFPFFLEAAVMNSQNFRIGSDVFGTGGGIGNSATYKIDGTTGETVVGISDSATFGVDARFCYFGCGRSGGN